MSIANQSVETLPPVSSITGAGKGYRLGRIFARDGRTVVLPVDHGTMLGRTPGLEDPVAVVSRFLELPCDGFLLGPGVATRSRAIDRRRSPRDHHRPPHMAAAH
jgi:DhnA family fructose-bisphosphate aldolase class Ia